jgi:ATP phosphoribosyltransferase regulatory subunit HisZ
MQTMEYYSVTKMEDIISIARKWMELVIIRLSEVRQVKNNKVICFLSYAEARCLSI